MIPSPASETFFRTPDEELDGHQPQTRKRRSSAGGELDRLISRHHAQWLKPRSWVNGVPASFSAWKREARRRMEDVLVIPDSLGQPSRPVLRSREDHGEFFLEEVEITLTPPLRTTALVTIPKNGAVRHPALLLLHSYGGLNLFGKEKFLARPGEPDYLRVYRQENYEGRSLLADFARAGYLCMAIDALGFGERLEIGPFEELDRIRRQMTGREAETFRVERIEREYQKTFRSLSSVGLSTAAVIATDDMRCIDYLASREDVDAGRIGCGGLSMGSFRSHYLAALDERIRATVSVCWVSIHAGVVDFNLPNSMGFFALPGSLYADYDLIDLPIVAAPRPFLAISGWHDILMEPRGMTEAHRILRRAWETAGAPECLGSLVFDAPHTFNREMQERALAFYHRFLV